MKILIIGYENHIEEFKLKFGNSHDCTLINDASEGTDRIKEQDVVFDFLLDESPSNFEIYQHIENLPVFVNVPKTSLAEQIFMNGEVSCTLFGFNGLPSFLNREVLEVSILNDGYKAVLETTCKSLNTEYVLVDDRVGMATPRIICMIINEAYYTVQEGTAHREDIDQGMKLGTNYPYGPFEWCGMIGVNNVYELLEAVYDDTKDERYKICPLLKKEYLLG